MGFTDCIWTLARQMVESGIIRTMAQSDITGSSVGGVLHPDHDCHTDQSRCLRIAGSRFDSARHSAGTVGKIIGHCANSQSVCFNQAAAFDLYVPAGDLHHRHWLAGMGSSANH